MVSAEFFLLGHVSPRLLGAAWLIGNKVSISLWLIPLHCRAHPTLGCAPGSCRKKSTGLIHLLSVDSPALLQLLSLLPSIAAQLWWKKARAEMLVLVRGFLVGLYPKGSSYKQEIPFFFLPKMKAPSPCFSTFLKISGQATQPVVSSSLTRDWTHLHWSTLHWKHGAFIIGLPRKSPGDSSLGLHTTIYTGTNIEYSILE